MEFLKIFQKERNLISFGPKVKPENEPVTRGMPYNFAVMNSPVTGHLGKRIINPKWGNQF